MSNDDDRSARVVLPVTRFPCPSCGKWVKLISPNWLNITVDRDKRIGMFDPKPHVPDRCIDCGGTPDADFHKRVLRRVDIRDDDVLYHLRGTRSPGRVSGDRLVQIDEYFVLRPKLPRRNICPSELLPIRGLGTGILREFHALALSFVGLPGHAIIYWRGDGESVEVIGFGTQQHGQDLFALTALKSDVPAKRVHTLVSVKAQLRDYLLSLPSESKPNREQFVLDVLNPPISMPTWNRNCKSWNTNWRTLVREIRLEIDTL